MKKAYESVEFGGRNLFVSSTATDGYPNDNAVGAAYSIHSITTSHEAYNLISVEPDTSYTVQYWIDDATYHGWVCVQLLDASGNIVSKVTRTYPAADYWTTTFTTPSTAVTALVSGRHLSTSYDYIPAKLMFEKGTKPSDWCVANEDLAIEEQYVYISKSSGTGSVNAITTWITLSSDQQNAWTTKRPLYDSDYPVLFVAKQRRMANGDVLCTTPVKDDTTTIIDGGHITTGLIDASRINLNTLYVSGLADGDQYARTDILDSMGDQLVVNGNGYLGDNTNFSGFTYDPTQVCNSYGSFRIDGASTTYKYADRYIPVDTAKRYMTGLSFKNTDSSKQTSVSYTIMCYDNDGNITYYCHSDHIEESTTTLAQDLVAGDEYVYFTDVSGFDSTVSTGHSRRLLFWNYTDSTGRTWEAGTYTRNVIGYNAWSSGSDIDYANNRIKLAKAYTGNTVPAGTSVSQGTGRDAPITVISLTRASSDWQTIRETFGFGCGSERFFPGGTVKIRLRIYTTVATNDEFWLANFWVKEQPKTNPYAICDAEASSTIKDVVCDDYEREIGSTITIKFTNGNSATYPTIRITSNSVRYASASVKNYTGGNPSTAERTWATGAILMFMYDGTNYRLLDGGSTAATASIASTVNSSAVTRSRRIYYRTATAITNGPGRPGTTSSAWDTVSDTDTNVFNQWTTKPPRLTQNSDGSGTKYPFLYTCEQRQYIGGTIGYTDVRLDDTTTVIDGGTIVTGQIAANRLDVFDANIQKLKTEYIDADSLQIKAGNVTGQLVFSQIENLENVIDDKADRSSFDALNEYVNGSGSRYFLTLDETALADKIYYQLVQQDGASVYVQANVAVGDSVEGYYESEILLNSKLEEFWNELNRQDGRFEPLELLSTAVVIDAENATVSVGYLNASGQFVAAKTRMSEGGFDILDNTGEVITHVGEQIDIGKLEGCHITAVGDHMSFMNGNDEVAYIDVDDNGESVFYMTRSVVVKDMFLGENRWKFFKRENNNLSLKWTGV